MAAAQANPQIISVLTDPFALTPGFKGPAQPDGSKAYEDTVTGSWVAPFRAAAIDTKVVHRSNFLMGHPDPVKRQTIQRLLAEEETKLALALAKKTESKT
jgi:hypothetical protein